MLKSVIGRYKMRKSNVIIGFAVSAVILICITAGCIGDGSSDLSSTLVYAGEGVDSINPIMDTHGELSAVVFSGLMKYDENNQPIVDLAESYTYDPASYTYKFKLRHGVKWHDGRPFTSDDVVFTYKCLMDSEVIGLSSVTSNYEDIESIIAPDDYTVIIKLRQPNAAMLDYFAIGIIPKHLLNGKDILTDSFNQHPIGTGKYKMVSWDTAGGMIILERNTEYYGNVPNIERVIYKTVAVESTKATMLMSGEADLAWLNTKYAEQFRTMSGYTNYDFQTADYRGAAMDYRTKFWQENGDSVGVLNYAIDKDAIIRAALVGRGIKAYSPIQLNYLGGNKKADTYCYDLEKFRKEMEKLGWKKGSDGIYERNGQKFHFTIQVRDYEEERVEIANLLSQMLKDAGVEMEIVTVTKFDWTKGYNGFLAGYATEFDADQMYAQFTTRGSSNTMKYSNSKVDELLTKARHETNIDKRRAAYGEFEEVFSENPGVLLVAYLQGNYVSSDGLKGLNTNRLLGHHAVGVMWNIEEWTLSK